MGSKHGKGSPTTPFICSMFLNILSPKYKEGKHSKSEWQRRKTKTAGVRL